MHLNSAFVRLVVIDQGGSERRPKMFHLPDRPHTHDRSSLWPAPQKGGGLSFLHALRVVRGAPYTKE
jgi:hypothetical protein